MPEREGKPDFFIFGEVFSGNEQLLSYYTTRSDMPAVLDFNFQEKVRQLCVQQRQRGRPDRICSRTTTTSPTRTATSTRCPPSWATMTRGRFGYFLERGQRRQPERRRDAGAVKLAHALMYFARGVPVVYYGDEQGFTGTGGDKDARQDMFPSQVAEYNDPTSTGRSARTAPRPTTTSTRPIRSTRRWPTMPRSTRPSRRCRPAHRSTATPPTVLASTPSAASTGTSRSSMWWPSTTAAPNRTPTFPFYAANAGFTRLCGTRRRRPTLTTDGSGQLTVTVPALGFVIYQADSTLAAMRRPAALTRRASPSPRLASGAGSGARLPDAGRQPRARSHGNRGRRWIGERACRGHLRRCKRQRRRRLAAHRHRRQRALPRLLRRQRLAAGTKLEFVAVVNDLNGHYNGADQVVGITPNYAQRRHARRPVRLRGRPLPAQRRRLRRPHDRRLQRLLGPAPVGRCHRPGEGTEWTHAQALPG